MTTPHAAADQPTMWLAWAGWQMRVPQDWRPLMMHGTPVEGSMLVGTGSAAALKIIWWRPSSPADHHDRWLRRRLGKIPALRTTASPAGTVPTGFKELAWLPPGTLGTAHRQQAIWYGQALAVPLVLQFVLNVGAVPNLEHQFRYRLLPSLEAQKPGDAQRWAVFNVSFISPPGFTLEGKRLFPGDMALWFKAPQREQLLVRQIYPTELALHRLGLEVWLTRPLQKEYFLFRPRAPLAAWAFTRHDRSWQGIRRSGHKQLPFPLQGWRARYSQAAIVKDERYNRLLVTEFDSAAQTDDTLLQDMISGMNWAMAS